MRKILLLCTLILLGVAGWFCFRSSPHSPPSLLHIKNSYGPYCFFVELAKLNASSLPCVTIDIGSRKLEALLDTGCRASCKLSPEVIESLEHKKWVGSEMRYALQNYAVEHKIYEGLFISFGPIYFSDVAYMEQPAAESQAGIFIHNPDCAMDIESATVGWELFLTSNLFLDLGNNRFGFADSIASIQENGYPHPFYEVPMLLEQGEVECYFATEKGPLRCLLDTGSTFNHLNATLSFEEALATFDQKVEYEHFQLASQEFGPIAFHPLPISIPIQIEAILGMEFLRDHIVFLDFSLKRLYFAKSTIFHPVHAEDLKEMAL